MAQLLKKLFSIPVISFCCMGVSTLLHAASPISVFNSSPLVAQIHQVSFPSTGSDRARSYYELNSSVSNYWSHGTDGGDTYSVDGETLVVNQTIAGSVSKRNSIGLSMPWVHHSGGIFDSAIYHFHDALALPQNGRSRHHQNRITWNIVSNGNQAGALNHSSQAQGDATLFLDHAGTDNTSLRVELDLPTGDFNKRSSDEATAASISYLSSKAGAKFEIWHGMGLTLSDKIGTLNSLGQKTWVVAGVLGMSYSPIKQLALKAQLNGHTAYFNNDLRELGWVPVILNFEAAYEVASSDLISVYFGEDLRPRTSPDFSLGLQYRHSL